MYFTVISVALIGLGFIGDNIANALETFLSKQFKLKKIYDIDKTKINHFLERFSDVTEMKNLTDFDDCDIVIEAASQEVVKEIFGEIIKKGKTLIPMSIGAFTTYDDVYQKYKRLSLEQKRKIIFPAGAIGGFDAIESIGLIGYNEVRLETHKPLRVFENDDYVKNNNIILNPDKPTLIFEGNAKEAAKYFPKSINVASRLALSTIGPEKTKVRIYANPAVKKNIHKIYINSVVGSYSFVFENSPSPSNPRTSWLAALSVISCLQKIVQC